MGQRCECRKAAGLDFLRGREPLCSGRAPIETTNESEIMPRKTSYRFDRMERERQKAAKKAARAEEKKLKQEQRKAEKAENESPSRPPE